MMDLGMYTLEEVFQAAIKAEQGSYQLYSDLSDNVKNAFLKEKLRFLAQEEKKHESLLRKEFGTYVPGKDLVIPSRSPVPLPGITISDEMVPLTEIIDSAMKAELAARDFYLSMKEAFDEGERIRETLDYFATMEFAHYQLLSIERENLAQFEDYDTYWDMMNIGP